MVWHMWLSEQKPDMFAYKIVLKFILLPHEVARYYSRDMEHDDAESLPIEVTMAMQVI